MASGRTYSAVVAAKQSNDVLEPDAEQLLELRRLLRERRVLAEPVERQSCSSAVEQQATSAPEGTSSSSDRSSGSEPPPPFAAPSIFQPSSCDERARETQSSLSVPWVELRHAGYPVRSRRPLAR